MTLLPTSVVTDHEMPDGILHGFNATGDLVVSMHYMHPFRRTVGTERDDSAVSEWHVSPTGARRLRAMAAWNSGGHPTAGWA